MTLVCAGIDHGTATSLAMLGAVNPEELVTGAGGPEPVPSVVAFVPSGAVEVGQEAKLRRLQDPKNTLFSVKRVLGLGWLSEAAQEFRRGYPFELVQGEGGDVLFETRAGTVTPVQVVTHLVRELLQRPPLRGAEIGAVTMSVPPSFTEAQRLATLEAARGAGLEEVTLVDEPVAALCAYHHLAGTEGTVAVYDLGGGTFDLAVLRNGGSGYEVLAAGGDPYLGGDDVDRRCAEWAREQILKRFRWDVGTDASASQALVFACEAAKIRLTAAEATDLDLGTVEPSLAGKSLRLSRVLLQELIVDIIRRSFVACDEVLSRAGVRAREVDAVVLSGGGCYMQSVQQAVGAYFGARVRRDLPVDRVVALGAARVAALGSAVPVPLQLA